MALTREQILGADDRGTRTVAVPEWGGDVVVRALTGTERDAFEASMIRQRGSRQELVLSNVRARLCAMAIVDEAGARVFSDADVRELGAKSAVALERVWNVARELSGLGDNDVEALAEDFAPDPSDVSTFGSPLSSD